MEADMQRRRARQHLTLPVALAVLRLAFVLAEGLARALATDSDGGRRITWAEWQGIAADLWSQLRSLDLADSRPDEAA